MRYWIAQKLFYWLFKGYVFPFERLNDKLFKMNETQRKNYFASAKEALDNPAVNDVLQEATRKFYQELSVKVVGKINQTAYRTTLLWINEQFLNKLKELAGQFTGYNPESVKDKFQ